MFRTIPILTLTVLATAVVQPVAAQTVRGQVADSATGAPVGTGFVVLLSEDGEEVARGLTNDRGRFSLEAPRPGRYRLRSERIGYGVWVSAPFQLDAGQTLEYSPTVVALPVILESIEIQAETQCRLGPDQSESTALLWEEARKALAAASWSASQRMYRQKLTRYIRDLDLRRRRVESEETATSAGLYSNPFSSVEAAELAELGYIVEQRDGRWYRAPDANVLLDETFHATHCFRAVRDGDHKGMIGLRFEPVPGRHLSDIVGVLWLDEASSELQSLEFRYTDLPYGIRDDRIGGTVEFMPLPSGSWIVHRWQIRMPALGLRLIHNEYANRRDTVLQGFRDTGGEVMEISDLAGAAVYSAGLARILGTVFDSTQAAPLAGATVHIVGTDYSTSTNGAGQFDLVAPLEGEYTVALEHDRLDSLGFTPAPQVVILRRGESSRLAYSVPSLQTIARAHCSTVQAGVQRRIVMGVVQADGQPVAGADVVASWGPGDPEEGEATLDIVGGTAVTDSTGRYVLCNLPADRSVRIVASVGSMMSGVATFEAHGSSAPASTPARHDLPPIDRRDFALAATASLEGVVTDSATSVPLEGASIWLLGTQLRWATDTTGAFRVEGLAAGKYQFLVRQFGYTPVRVEVSLQPGVTTRLREQALALAPLTSAVPLDPVVVEGREVPRRLAPFERRRAIGIGSFMTREEIESYHPRLMTDIVRRMPGIGVRPNPNYGAGDPRRLLVYNTRRFSTWAGQECPLLVFVDGAFIGDTRQADLDLLIPPEGVQAMETYSSPAQVPTEFDRTGSACGVIVLWLR